MALMVPGYVAIIVSLVVIRLFPTQQQNHIIIHPIHVFIHPQITVGIIYSMFISQHTSRLSTISLYQPNLNPIESKKILNLGRTTRIPSRNPKNQNFYYYNKNKCHYFDKHNNKQRVQPPTQPVTHMGPTSA